MLRETPAQKAHRIRRQRARKVLEGQEARNQDLIIEQNMTGQQMATVLDTLLFSGIEALLFATTFVDQHILSLFNFVCRNNRRHISSHDGKEIQISCLLNVLCSTRPQEKLHYYVKFRPDRYISFGILNKFLIAVGNYQEIYHTNSDEVKEIERAVGCGRDRLWSVIQTVRDCVDAAYRFRNYEVRKYIGLCRQEAIKVQSKSPMPLDIKGLTQNFLQAVIISIDKYDHKKGALTSYIKPWLRYLRQSPEFGHEMGLAYDIPWNYKARIGDSGYSNIAYQPTIEEDPIDGKVLDANHDSVLEELQHQEAEQLTMLLIKQADPTGIIRLSLGLTEVMGEEQYRQMRQQSRQEAQGLVLIGDTAKRRRMRKKRLRKLTVTTA